ncbi:MAG: hypothetical protein QOH49_2065 [Acidobacteriota bacterium]|nr:hypothetical protein [Acidobacteriota bacterium]
MRDSESILRADGVTGVWLNHLPPLPEGAP